MNDQWATPRRLFDELNAEFAFTLDVCATAENAKCENYYSPKQDGLQQAWSGRCWMNPPYGRAIKEWIKKAHQAARDGALVVCLLPAKTDTGWWHDYVMKASEIRFLRGRLYFNDGPGRCPFPCAVVVFRPGDAA